VYAHAGAGSKFLLFLLTHRLSFDGLGRWLRLGLRKLQREVQVGLVCHHGTHKLFIRIDHEVVLHIPAAFLCACVCVCV